MGYLDHVKEEGTRNMAIYKFMKYYLIDVYDFPYYILLVVIIYIQFFKHINECRLFLVENTKCTNREINKFKG